MRGLAILTLAIWPELALADQVRDTSLPMVAVAGYDKARLVGDWYEVARSDSALEVDCHGVAISVVTP
jgi:lipocalin